MEKIQLKKNNQAVQKKEHTSTQKLDSAHECSQKLYS